MQIRHSMCWAILICITHFVSAEEPIVTKPKESLPNAVKVDKLINQVYPIRVQPLPAGKTEKAIICLPDKLVWDLASRIKEKQPGIAPIERSPNNYSKDDSLPHGATIIAGIAISLAMISFVFLRQRYWRWAKLCGVVGVFVLGVAAANYSKANLAPTPEMILKGDHCKIVVIPDGREVLLLISQQ